MVFFILIFLSFNSSNSYSQTSFKTNLDIFYELVDSSINSITDEIPSSDTMINLSLNLGEVYTVFNNQIISSFTKKNKKILGSNDNDSGAV
ncbi:MAG: hypothetical protein ABI550_04010, partial [Ignavibacteriaceae bacterium]